MLGLYGGSFDPPHLGHVELARRAKQELGLERLLVLVSADPGHKHVETPADMRLRLARGGVPGRRGRARPTPRTVDMLRAHPEWHDPIFLIGADQFRDFPSWKEPAEVLRLHPARRRDAARLPAASARRGARAARASRSACASSRSSRLPISSRELRARLAAGEDVSAELPPAVAG